MSELLKKRIKEKLPVGANRTDIHNFSVSLAYSCRMYWLNRTDKISSDDYELYRELTNALPSVNGDLVLEEDYKPTPNGEALFKNVHSHSNLEKELMEYIQAHFVTTEPKKEGFFEKIWNSLF